MCKKPDSADCLSTSSVWLTVCMSVWICWLSVYVLCMSVWLTVCISVWVLRHCRHDCLYVCLSILTTKTETKTEDRMKTICSHFFVKPKTICIRPKTIWPQAKFGAQMLFVYYVWLWCDSLWWGIWFLVHGHSLVALKPCKFCDSRTFGFLSRIVGNIHAP